MDRLGNLRRTHYASELLEVPFGTEVTVAGFVARSRNLGNLIFTDVRDVTGITQLAFDDGTDSSVFEKAKTLHNEYVLIAKGILRERSSKTDKVATGALEVYVTEMNVLSGADTTPFEIRDDISNVRDDLTLKYRYLDLRRPSLTNNIVMRSKIMKVTRDFFAENHFVEIETPMLTKSTPEGARDYLVPSRVQEGKFFALPQSPQQYKQLLMLSGFDRYIQIVRCFRDEDLRADRQPEFTQIDMEMAFMSQDDIMDLNELYLQRLFKEVINVDVPLPLKRIPYSEAMDRYGSDKPDTRFGLELVNLNSVFANTSFEVFRNAIDNGGSVRAINAKNLADKISRKEIDKLTDIAKKHFHAKGLAYTRVLPDGRSSSFEKFLTEQEIQAMDELLQVETNDVLLIIADAKDDTVLNTLGSLRKEIADKYELYDPSVFDLLWVVDFPLFEYSEEDNRFYAKHHPFTMPNENDIPYVDTDQGRCRAQAYDIVINGTEAGGGSIRINNPELQKKMFHALGFTEEKAEEQFGHLIEAYRYGAPPHGGLAYGLDRLVMLMLGLPSIREVIAFPKVQNTSEPMMASPSFVSEEQLKELHIQLDIEE